MGALGFAIRTLDPTGLPRAVVTAFGLVCLLVGAITLVARRRRMFMLIIALCGLIVGGFVGGLIAEALDPVPHYRGAPPRPWGLGMAIWSLCTFIGAVILPVVIVIIAGFTSEMAD